MGLVIILLLILTLIFSLFNRKEGLLWIVVILTTVAIGALADILRMNVLPDEVHVGTVQVAVLFVVSSFIFLHIPVCAFLMLTLSFYRMAMMIRRTITWIGLLPSVYDAWHTPFVPSYEIHYAFVFWLWFSYIFAATWLLLNRYVQTPPSIEKKHYLSLILIYLPHPWLALFTIILPLFLYGVGGEWAYFRITLQWSLSLAFLLNLYYIVYPGFLGVRLSSLRRKTGSRAVASGVEIMNHSLKNEANKLLFMAGELEMPELREEDRHQYIQLIRQSALEMSAMLEKLNTQTREVTINLGVHSMDELLETVRERCALLLHRHTIRLSMDVRYTGSIVCDLPLMADDLANLIDNSIHAVIGRDEPQIRIEVSTYGRYVYVGLWDNGYGISKKNLDRLFEPYFTTKNKSSNLALAFTSVITTSPPRVV